MGRRDTSELVKHEQVSRRKCGLERVCGLPLWSLNGLRDAVLFNCQYEGLKPMAQRIPEFPLPGKTWNFMPNGIVHWLSWQSSRIGEYLYATVICAPDHSGGPFG